LFGPGEIGNREHDFEGSAIVSIMTGAAPAEVMGQGTGVDDKQLKKKRKSSRKALDVNQADPSNALDVPGPKSADSKSAHRGIDYRAASIGQADIDRRIHLQAGALIGGLCPESTEYMISATKRRAGHIVLWTNWERTARDLDFRLGEGRERPLAILCRGCGAECLTEVEHSKNRVSERNEGPADAIILP